MKRISIVGTSGAGKTTVAAKLAERIGLPHIELDALYHQPDWQPAPREELREALRSIIHQPGWVIDGNYGSVARDLVWAAADTVVWLDPSRAAVMAGVTRRTLSRVALRRELWNGNRESFRSLLDRRPEENIILWAWTQLPTLRDRYGRAMADPANGHLEFIHLQSRREVRRWLETLDS
jgi:adenylate kinase family enzyme